MILKKDQNVEAAFNRLKCSLRNENYPQVFKLSNGARIVYYPADYSDMEAGYTNIFAKEYKLVSPSGSLVSVTNIRAFCKDVFGANPSGSPKYCSSFSDMFNGVRATDNVLGWKKYEESSRLELELKSANLPVAV
ncbi:hypothetical protein WKK05_35000 [Nostoc sp. UHCC 0302]|uniref:hypothetical protein n=1 Tax=Nostoc sp. UHCC 0302 TaxID=3134896 RepID=UPI00311CBC3A